MNGKKNRVINGVISIAILIVSLAIMIIDFAVPSVNIFIHPVLTFLMCMCIGFGVWHVCLGVASKSIFYTFVGSIFFGLALFYVLICLLNWWIALVSLIVFWLIMGCLISILFGNPQDDCAMNKEGDGYKDYEERKLEEEKTASEESSEVPELKSFKD